MSDTEYQICTRCIMDTSDPDITFDENGVCNHCHSYDRLVEADGYKPGTSEKQLESLVATMKEAGKGREYDCVLGISGGVDSSYMALLAKQLELRVLAVHVDAGWNSELAVDNIQKMCSALEYDLHTVVVDWPAIKELQRAYMFSGLANLDIPQDHAFVAGVYNYAHKHNIKYILNGSNCATEGILPQSWGHSALDYANIKAIYKAKGRGVKILDRYPHFNLAQYGYYMLRFNKVRLLNYVDYSKAGAIELLEREFGWNYYGGKHFESRFTKFFQSYYLPLKFGYDKRRAHLASLIVGGEMQREDALVEMERPYAYPLEQMLEDRDYILKKLDISLLEWEGIMAAATKTDDDYKNNKKLIGALTAMRRALIGKSI